MKKKFLLISSFALVFMFILASCSVVNDLSVVSEKGKTFMTALENNDPTTSWNLMLPELQANIGTQADWETYVKSNKFSDSKFSSTNVENSTGTLEGEVTINGDPYSTNLTFEKVNSEWVMTAIDIKRK